MKSARAGVYTRFSIDGPLLTLFCLVLDFFRSLAAISPLVLFVVIS